MNVGSVSPGQPGVTGKGAPPEQTSYNLDGVAISLGGVSPIFFDFDALSDIEVTTGGSDLSLATPGVTVNLVTRRGTNQLMGSARGFYVGGAGWDYGAEAGGPLWKDRLWLWGAFAHNDFPGTTRLNNADEPLESQQTFEHWNGKLNSQLSSSTRSPSPTPTSKETSSGFNPDGIAPRSPTGTTVARDSPSGSRIRRSCRRALRVVLPGLREGHPTSLPVGGIEEQAVQDEDEVWRHSYRTRRFSDDQRQAGVNASAFFDTGDLRHEVKFGFGYRQVRQDSMQSWPGDLLVGWEVSREAGITRRQDAATRANLYDVFSETRFSLAT